MPAFHPTQFRRVVRASAVYDLVVTAPFATPWTFAIALGHLGAVNQALGGPPLPAFEPLHQLFALLMASVVMVWSWLRLRTPTATLGRHDAATRLLFSTWMLWTWLQTGAPVMLVFLLPEISWAVVQAWPVRGAAAAPEHSARGNRAFGGASEYPWRRLGRTIAASRIRFEPLPCPPPTAPRPPPPAATWRVPARCGAPPA